MTHKILILPGDGIGPEIMAEAEKVLVTLRERHGLDTEWTHAPIGGAGYDAAGVPLPEATLIAAKAADAVLLAAVGGPKYDTLPRELRPERGLLAIRSALGLFANLRPAILYPELASRSLVRSLASDSIAANDPTVAEALVRRLGLGSFGALDILIVRELTGGIYFGQPRGIEMRNGERVGFNTEVYSESEIERIARVAFVAAMGRKKHLCSVDKANVLESSELWREVVIRVGKEFPEVTLTHQYVDNAAMQLVRAPQQFDVILASNLFGDILSDLAAQLTGSIGMLPSASLNAGAKGLYEPIHGSAPDIAGTGAANPLAMIGSIAMMLRHSLDRNDLADKVQAAIRQTLASGRRTGDIAGPGMSTVTTSEMGDAVVAALS